MSFIRCVRFGCLVAFVYGLLALFHPGEEVVIGGQQGQVLSAWFVVIAAPVLFFVLGSVVRALRRRDAAASLRRRVEYQVWLQSRPPATPAKTASAATYIDASGKAHPIAAMPSKRHSVLRTARRRRPSRPVSSFSQAQRPEEAMSASRGEGMTKCLPFRRALVVYLSTTPVTKGAAWTAVLP